MVGEEIIEDWFDKIQLVQKGNYHKIKIENLTAGKYVLDYVDGTSWVGKTIEVLKGQGWQASD